MGLAISSKSSADKNNMSEAKSHGKNKDYPALSLLYLSNYAIDLKTGENFSSGELAKKFAIAAIVLTVVLSIIIIIAYFVIIAGTERSLMKTRPDTRQSSRGRLSTSSNAKKKKLQTDRLTDRHRKV